MPDSGSEPSLVPAIFKLQYRSYPNEYIVVAGSPPPLGSWDITKALKLKQEGETWVGSAELSPGEFEYKFVAMRGDPCTAHWDEGPNRKGLVVEKATGDFSARWSPAVPEGLASSPGMHGEPAEVEFILKYVTSEDEQVLLTGSSPDLGNWNPESAKVLTKTEGDLWIAKVPFRPPQDIDYKLLVFAGPTNDRKTFWESGPNRKLYVPGPGATKVHLEWVTIPAHFLIYYPLPDGKRMHIVGDPPELGSWGTLGPQPMTLGEPRQLPTGVSGCCWELKTTLSRLRVPGSFQYRYVVVDEEKKTAVFEREPNRKQEVSSARLADGSLFCFDVNFVAGMNFDVVPPDFFIGPYPQSPEDIDAMQAAGVSAVLNVQTDEDHKHRMVDWPSLLSHYEKCGIEVVRHQIRDFDGEDLKVRLAGAVGVVADLIKRGKKVYVHCTAGMGRAPAVVVLYQCWHRGLSPDAALAYVKLHRPVAAPNMGVIRTMAAQPPPPAP